MDVESPNTDLTSNGQTGNVSSSILVVLIEAVNVPSIAALSADTFALIAGATNVVANLRAAGISR